MDCMSGMVLFMLFIPSVSSNKGNNVAFSVAVSAVCAGTAVAIIANKASMNTKRYVSLSAATICSIVKSVEY